MAGTYTPKALIATFNRLFPFFTDKAKRYITNGKNGLRVELNDGREMIFTYYGNDRWMIERR